MKEIMDANALRRSMVRLAHEIIEKNKGTENLVLVGIKTRGEFLARRMTEMINSFEGSNVPCVAIDILPWHDKFLRVESYLSEEEKSIQSSVKSIYDNNRSDSNTQDEPGDIEQ